MKGKIRLKHTESPLFRFCFRISLRSALIIVYVLAVLAVTGFDIRKIIDLQELFLVLCGTGLFLVGSLSDFTGIAATDIVPYIILCCRPILYGFVLQVILLVPEEAPLPKDSASLHSELPPIRSAQEMYDLFRKTGLSKREAEIARLAANGLSNAEIAEGLFIAPSTVKKHMSNIFEKLNISSRDELKR